MCRVVGLRPAGGASRGNASGGGFTPAGHRRPDRGRYGSGVTKDKTAGAVFSDWISTEVRPFLSARGWRRTGLVFEEADGANSGLIAFRRWKWNTHDTCRFFVEAGVFSPRLAREEADWAGLPVPMTPTLRLGAIGARLAALMGEREELFWTVRASSLALELEALGESVREKIEIFVLPFVEAHASDEAIRDQLLAHLDDLGPEQVRWLTRLLADLGPADRLPEVRDQVGLSEARLAAERGHFDELERGVVPLHRRPDRSLEPGVQDAEAVEQRRLRNGHEVGDVGLVGVRLISCQDEPPTELGIGDLVPLQAAGPLPVRPDAPAHDGKGVGVREERVALSRVPRDDVLRPEPQAVVGLQRLEVAGVVVEPAHVSARGRLDHLDPHALDLDAPHGRVDDE